uniref:Prolyl endopeptidase n=1 Tax=Strongyloides stercoralis TaxID=6248 RepID=A0A0K0ENP8_STRER
MYYNFINIFAFMAFLPLILTRPQKILRLEGEITKIKKQSTEKPKKYDDCESRKNYFNKRYHSLIKINVTNYPVIERCETCCEQKFGHKTCNYYEYLEDLKNEKTKDFIKKINSISYKYLSTITIRNYIKRKITKNLYYGRHSTFTKRGKYYYYTYNSGTQNHSVIMRREKYYSDGEVFFDVNKYDETGRTSLTDFTFTNNGKIMAYLLSVNGSDWGTIKFMTENGKPLKDTLINIKLCHMSFAFNGRGLFYSTYSNKKDQNVPDENGEHTYHSLYYHVMGTPQSKDILVANYPENKNVIIEGFISRNQRHLFIYYFRGADAEYNAIKYFDLHRIHRKKINGKLRLRPLFTEFDASYSIIDSDCQDIYVLTTKNAPKGRLIRVSIRNAHKGEKVWKELIKTDPKRKLESVTAAGEKYLIVHYSEDLEDKVYIHDKRTGRMITKLNLEPGTLIDISASTHQSRFFLQISNQVSPQTMYTGNLLELKHSNKIKMKVIIKPIISGVKKSDYVMKKIFYESKDSTKVPLHIFHKKGIKFDGNNPLLLEGYGGFGISFLPSYSSSKLMFVNNFDGIYVIAGIRGGGEYEVEWHKNGSLHNKQNSFDDFIAAAKYLIKENYTNPSKLAIIGASNGGILTAVVSQQRPDLFGTVITKVGVLDMLRFHKFTIGSAWIPEYGDPDKEEDFNYLLKYSPLHNIKMPKRPVQWPSTLVTSGLHDDRMPERPVQWPSTLITSGLHDDRVVASHTLKYAAQLYHDLQQGISYQRNPVLVRVSDAQGHNGAVTFKRKVEETTDVFAFIKETLNIKWKYDVKN